MQGGLRPSVNKHISSCPILALNPQGACNPNYELQACFGLDVRFDFTTASVQTTPQYLSERYAKRRNFLTSLYQR